MLAMYIVYTRHVKAGVAMKSTVFMNNRTQAVRLPKSVALPADVRLVDVVVIGRSRIISPKGEKWDAWFDGAGVSDDFMLDREQPKAQDRPHGQ